MNYEKSKVLLKKINALHDSMDHASGSSSLEKDLFLQYLRELYENVSSHSSDNALKEESSSNGSSSPELTKPVIETIKEPVIVSKKDLVTNVHPTPEKVSIAEEAIAAPISDEILKLLEESDASFDSSRILGGKIAKIGKAMGINERILTINELFEGQQPLFEETVDQLDKIKSYKEAKIFLANGIAKTMNWGEEQKKGKAIHFLHLVIY